MNENRKGRKKYNNIPPTRVPRYGSMPIDQLNQRGSSADPFNDSGNALTTPHAGRDHTEFLIKSLKIINVLNSQLTACASQWMPQGYGPAIDIYFLWIKSGFSNHRKGL